MKTTFLLVFSYFPFVYWVGRTHPIGQWRPRPILARKRRLWRLSFFMVLFPLFFFFLFFSFLSLLSPPPFFWRGGGKPAASLWIRAWVILNKVKVSNLCGNKSYHKQVFEFKLCHIRRQWETKLYYECKDEVLSISSVVKDATYRGQ